MSVKPAPEKIKYLIRSKINQYLKNKPYSSAKIREKLLILPLKYPEHYYYPYYTAELIDEVIENMEKDGSLNNQLFIEEIYQQLEFKAWSNQEIWEYLQYKLMFDKELIEELKKNNPYRDEGMHLAEIIRKLKMKINKWQRKYDNYTVEQKIKQELYKNKWTTETVEMIWEETKK